MYDFYSSVLALTQKCRTMISSCIFIAEGVQGEIWRRVLETCLLGNFMSYRHFKPYKAHFIKFVKTGRRTLKTPGLITTREGKFVHKWHVKSEIEVTFRYKCGTMNNSRSISLTSQKNLDHHWTGTAWIHRLTITAVNSRKTMGGDIIIKIYYNMTTFI